MDRVITLLTPINQATQTNKIHLNQILKNKSESRENIAGPAHRTWESRPKVKKKMKRGFQIKKGMEPNMTLTTAITHD
ncbi:hypothetical protein GCM10022394_11390 [Zobellella aerophila]|uniref:Uncharacterized protein n=1 Tax=Zobellella aerophila TaxID=870480 RepID=A0ABP6VDV5_9GAMM